MDWPQTGTFLYTFAGAGATAAYVLGNILELPGLGSQFTFFASLEAESAHTVVGLLQIGIAYAVGIALALAVCLVSCTKSGT